MTNVATPPVGAQDTSGSESAPSAGWKARLAVLPGSTRRLFVAAAGNLRRISLHPAAITHAARSTAAWANAHRRQAALVAVGLIGLIAAHIALFLSMVTGEAEIAEAPVRKTTLADALAALDAGRPREARFIAHKLEANREIGDRELGLYAYVLGVAAQQDAIRKKQPAERRRWHLVAARYLEQAMEEGVPAERRPHALLLLGQSQVATGQYAQGRVALLAAAPQLSGDQQAEAQRLLHTAYSRQQPPDHVRALQHIDAYLAHPTLRPQQREAGLIARADSLLRLGRTDELRQTLAKLLAKSELRADASLLRGRADLLDGDRAAASTPEAAVPPNAAKLPTDEAAPALPAAVKAKYEQAERSFREAHAADATDQRLTHQAMYLIGVALAKQHRWREAAVQFDRTEKQFYELAEGFAACVGQAETLRQLKEDEAAIAALKRAAVSPGREAQGDETWVTADEFRRLLGQWHRAYLTAGNASLAAAVAEVLAQAGDVGHALELLAETHAQRIRALQRSLAQPTANVKVDEVQKEIRHQTLLAAEAWSRLAQERFATPQYTEYLAKAAELYLRGQEFDRSFELWKEYLRYETGVGVPDALVSMAEAEMARGRVDRALKLAKECLESHPRSPLVYRARLLAAKAHEEQGDLKQALAVLEENLNSQLTPSSPEWREAKFESGRLLYVQASRLDAESSRLDALGPAEQQLATKRLEEAMTLYRDAIERLDEAVQRYPQAPQAVSTRLMLAEAYRQTARWPQRKLRSITILQQIAALNKEINSILTTSLGHYQKLQDDLNRKQERQPLPPVESAILRNCYFAIGGLYFDMGQYDLAIAAYKAAANAYQNHPEAVAAYFRIAACQRRRPGTSHEARGTLEQAKVVLGRMTAGDEEFVAATMRTKEEWVKLFDWMMQL